ncbi:MAG: bifunctional folylpolyglutamate synthase/dihydrofolate synthase [Clostridiales bacterium]|nr:bifunctional folylpolyglutamate synthase/dihydrofolate synthase [Clostridiales bacterium]
MDYNQAIEYIHGTYKFGSKLGLENIKDLLGRLGNPHKKFKYVHIAGTNGKGSVTSMISNILYEAGYKVGMFISPYLENFTERIQVNLNEIPRKELASITEIVKEKVDEMVASGRNHPTEFEIVTAIGFFYFAQQNVDIAVVEVGLGGRLDATNVVDKPLLSVITSIGFDHMDILGDSLGKITYEKAGIIKPGAPVISYPQLGVVRDVIRKAAVDKGTPLFEVSGDQISIKEISMEGNIFDFRYEDRQYRNIKLNLIGQHQLLNAATALTAIEVMRDLNLTIPEDAIYKGQSKVRWPGRLEKIHQSPTIIIDGAHNDAGADALANTINTFFPHEKVTLVLGVLKDKEVDAVVRRICPLVHTAIITRPDNPRAMDPNQLGKKVLEYCDKVIIEPKIEKAIDTSIDVAGQKGIVLICGSLYLVGTVRSYIKNNF